MVDGGELSLFNVRISFIKLLSILLRAYTLLFASPDCILLLFIDRLLG